MKYKCDSITLFKTQVLSSKGDQYYDVVNLTGGWNCSCPSFAFRKTCKHIAQAKQEVCTWTGPESDLDIDACPLCGGEVLLA